MVVHGYYFSQIPAISILKALNWTAVTIILLLTWNDMNFYEREKTKNLLITFLLIIVLISLAFLLFSDFGYELNSRYFQGILNHSMSFGLTAGSLLVLLLVKLFRHNRFKLFFLINILICIALVLASGSRTSGLALISAVLILLILFPLLNIYKFKILPHILINRLFS